MTTPTPEQVEAALAILQQAEDAARANAGVPAGVNPTIEQPLRHASSVWADETCAEEDGLSPAEHKGGFVVANDWSY